MDWISLAVYQRQEEMNTDGKVPSQLAKGGRKRERENGVIKSKKAVHDSWDTPKIMAPFSSALTKN